MPDDENKRVILRWFEAVNKGEITLLEKLADEFFTADFISHDPRMLDLEPGPGGIKKFISSVLQENINVHVTVQDIFSEEEKVAYRFSLSMIKAASGEPVNMQLLAIDRFVSGQIAEEWQLSAPGKW